MKHNQKVVWYEGMILDPHHFQQLDRYMHSFLEFKIRTALPYAWGLLDVEIDTNSLRNGQFTLNNCKGVTPDGLSFDMPAVDSVPQPRDLADVFPKKNESLNAYLSLPVFHPDGINCQIEQKTDDVPVRFSMEEKDMVDENTGQNTQKIGIASANYQIRFETESLKEYSSIQIAEIVRTTGGGYSLQESFIPPCLQIKASSTL